VRPNHGGLRWVAFALVLAVAVVTARVRSCLTTAIAGDPRPPHAKGSSGQTPRPNVTDRDPEAVRTAIADQAGSARLMIRSASFAAGRGVVHVAERRLVAKTLYPQSQECSFCIADQGVGKRSRLKTKASARLSKPRRSP
jgi:hypothetical protein